LTKLGYDVVVPKEQLKVTEILEKEIFDLVLIESGKDHLAVQFCEFLRGHDASRAVPIVCVTADPLEKVELRRMHLEKFELVEAPYSIGNLAARVATQLRLAKFAGQDNRTATLVEMNASLRDLNNRFTKEVDEARQIQESMLPESLPVDSRFALAASYQPLTEVGGDWYFADMSPGGKLRLQIADVTGHGLSAALIGSMTRLAMVAANREAPHELLTEMNRLMAPQLPAGRFVTMTSCSYDPVTGEIHSGRAGPPPVFVLNRATSEVRLLKGRGFPLGFTPDSEYTDEQGKLEVGDVLVLITDGISEGQNRAGEMYGFDRLGAALRGTAPHSSSAAIVEAILDDFEKFCDGRLLKDDVTIVALKRLA
jgi:sigma-B regulation protein RsbU (phosphoserine phosphatase)